MFWKSQHSAFMGTNGLEAFRCAWKHAFQVYEQGLDNCCLFSWPYLEVVSDAPSAREPVKSPAIVSAKDEPVYRVPDDAYWSLEKTIGLLCGGFMIVCIVST